MIGDLRQQTLPSQPSTRRDRNFHVARIIMSAMIALGILCAIYQYFYNRSLWLDEASLALNILDRSFKDLLLPLDYNQVAPIGFLMIEKLMVVFLGQQEYALRLFPLLCFIASVPLWYRGVKNLTNDIDYALMATAVFCVSWSFIAYATEVKQYSVDVMCTTLFLLLATSVHQKMISRILLLSIAGAVMIWFSNTSVILLFVLGLYVFGTEVIRGRRYAFLIPPIFWLVSFSIYYIFFIHNHPTRATMLNYWAADFMPFTIFSIAFYEFIVKVTSSVFGYLFGFGPFWPVTALIVIMGIIFAWLKRKYHLLFFCLAPILVHLILSGFHLYPFNGRLILYLLPFIMLLYVKGCIEGFHLLKKTLPGLPRLLLIIPVVILCYPLAMQFPVEKEEIKKSLSIIESRRQSGEQMYVYYGAIRAFAFYKRIGHTTLGEPLVTGLRSREDYRLYDEQLLQLKGKVWLLFSHVYDQHTELSEETYMINVLTAHGAQILGEWKFKGSRVYYVEMGNRNEND